MGKREGSEGFYRRESWQGLMAVMVRNQREKIAHETAVDWFGDEIGDDDIIDDVSISFYYFMFSFVDFDLQLQIKSNKFVKICKI